MIVYKTTNLINGKIYVGSDKNNNPKYLGSGKLLKQAIQKYGRENFKKEILCKCESLKDLIIKEGFWIKSLRSNQKRIGYNISSNYFGGDTFSSNPDKEITRLKMSKSSSGENNPMYKKSVYECWIERYGKEKADVLKNSLSEKISESMKGKNKKNLYDRWKERFGEIYASIKSKNLATKRRNNALKKNSNSKIVFVYEKNRLTRVFLQTKEAAKFYKRSPDFFIKNAIRVCEENDLSGIQFIKISCLTEDQKNTIREFHKNFI